jgi:hypothetical protein
MRFTLALISEPMKAILEITLQPYGLLKTLWTYLCQYDNTAYFNRRHAMIQSIVGVFYSKSETCKKKFNIISMVHMPRSIHGV